MKYKAILKYALYLFLLCLGVYIYLLLFPQVLFSNKISYRNFKIYSNEKIDDKIYDILDNAIAQLKTSVIYDSTITQKVFFIDGSFYYTMTKYYSKERGGYHEFLVNNTMVVPKVDVKNNSITFMDGRIRNLAQVIIHETVHSYQEKDLGFWKVIRIPEWKLEGYAFYISKTDQVLNNGHLSLNFIIKNFKEIQLHPNHKHYWFYAVLTGYLLNEKHLSYNEFLSDIVNQDATLIEFNEWFINNSNPKQELIGMK